MRIEYLRTTTTIAIKCHFMASLKEFTGNKWGKSISYSNFVYMGGYLHS